MQKIALLLFSCCLLTTLSAQESYAPVETDTTLLWRISGNGLGESSYLYGTIHMIPAKDYFLPPAVKPALDGAQKVAFEIDPREMEDPSMLFQLMGRINMRNDTSLSDLLTETEYDTVENYFSAMGLPMMFFKQMKPLFLSSMVGQDLSELSAGLSNAESIKSYEFELTRMAEEAETPIVGLESIDFQLSLFDSIPYKIQAYMLLDAIRADSGEGSDQFSEMVDMYKRQAVAEMAAIISEESAEAGRFEELLLTRRNENWIPIMADMMREGSGFFAVGAGHLGGEKGVISLLRQEGYTVDPVY